MTAGLSDRAKGNKPSSGIPLGSFSSSSASFKASYLLLLSLRFTLAWLGTSYIHPDEFFQSAEGALGTSLTWEFDPALPCRSMASVKIFNAPMLLLLWFCRYIEVSPSAATLFVTQKLTFALVSVVIDWSIWRLSPTPSIARRALLLWASSGAALSFALHTFSNNVEASILALILLIVKSLHEGSGQGDLQAKSDAWNTVSAVLGGLVALGCFSRFTFAVFAAPIAVVYLRLAWELSSRRGHVGAAQSRPVRLLLLLSGMINGFFLCSVGHVAYDTLYYNKRISSSASQPDLLTKALQRPPVLAPLNAFLYNLQSDNLGKHGIHPRWLHAAVNAPMIIGVSLWIASLVAAAKFCSSAVSRTTNKENAFAATRSKFPLEQVCITTVFVPLAILSAQPHQEPRFLLPLLTPSILLCASSYKRLHRLFKIGHAMQALAMIAFFGIGHQGGLVPALLHIDGQLRAQNVTDGLLSSAAVTATTSHTTLDVHIWRNFMPPRHLLTALWMQTPEGSPTLAVSLFDHGSMGAEDLLTTLHERASSAEGGASLQLLLAPSWALATLPSATERSPHPCFRLHEIVTFAPHIDTDHLGETLNVLRQTRQWKKSFGLVASRVEHSC
ncbi:unnamed protein product [Jaminaea pallidilutea]